MTINLGKGQLEPADPSPFRKAITKATAKPFPSPRQVAVDSWWYSLRFGKLTLYLPLFVLREIVPVLRGAWRLAAAWAHWKAVSAMAEGIAAAEANVKGKLTESRERKRTGRAIVSAVLAAALIGGYWRLWITHHDWAIAATIAFVVILDIVGRHGQERPDYAPPPALPAVLNASVPLGQIEQAILGTFDREGFEPGSVGVAVPLQYDPPRMEYRIQLSLRDELKAEHLRAIERSIGAHDYAIRNLATDTSTVRELVVRIGDPLAMPVDRPFLPTGSKSITEGIELGVSSGEMPFIVPAAGVHERAVMGTGGGKTSWYLRAEIDSLSACRDCVLGGIDVTNGPEFPLWRGVIQYRGFDPASAERVLQTALDEIARRAKILTAIAEDDDPSNDTTEWHAGLGPAFVILIDEFSALAAYDGKGDYKDEPNLLALVLQIVRTGRKHWVSVRMKSQRAGKDDFGSTTISTQCGVSVAGPCSPDDSITMFGRERRDAGYTPHMLTPGNAVDIRDAGKVMIMSPAHRTPDLYRVYAPGSASEVKRRARQRMEDGLPSLRDVIRPDTLDALEVPPTLAAVEAAFADAGNPDRLPSAVLAATLGTTPAQLAFDLRRETTGTLKPLARFRPKVGQTDEEWGRGYKLTDVQEAIRRLG